MPCRHFWWQRCFQGSHLLGICHCLRLNDVFQRRCCPRQRLTGADRARHRQSTDSPNRVPWVFLDMAPHPVSGPNPTEKDGKKTSKITHLHPQDGHPALQVCARHTARKNQSLLMRQISRFQVVPMLLHKLRHWNTDSRLDPEVLTIGSIVRTALHHQNHLKSIHSMCKLKPALSVSPTRLCQNSARINFVFTATTPSLDCFPVHLESATWDPLQAANQESRPGHPHGNRCRMWDIGRSDPIWGGCRRGRGPCHVLRIPTGTTDAHHCGEGCLLRNLTTNGNLAGPGWKNRCNWMLSKWGLEGTRQPSRQFRR